MSIVLRELGGILAVVITLGMVVKVRAQTPPSAAPPAKERAVDPREREKLEFFRGRFEPCHVTLAGREEPCQYVAHPLTRFDNPISKIEDGYMFLWTNRGRPVATVKSYHSVPNKSWGRTFVSLAERPLEMRHNDQPLWAPTEAGVKFVELPDSPLPAADPRRRLTQMRQISRRFQAIDNWGIKDPTDWQLRLLPAPLFRYEVKSEEVIDGALFGYVLTSPEALLLLEARDTGERFAWHYALSRCTRFGIRFLLDGKPIAEFDRLDRWPASGTYFHSALPWEEYPFDAAAPN